MRNVYERLIDLSMRAAADEPAEWMAKVSGLASTLPRQGRQMRTLQEVVQEIRDSPADASSAVLPTGLPSLDERLGGGLCSAVTILGGRPGMGKSALAAQIGVNVALSGKGTVLYFCMEMRNRQTVQRIISQRAGVRLSSVRHDAMSPDDRRNVVTACEDLSQADMKLLDLGTLTVSRIRAEIIAAQQSGPVALVVVDYLQQLAPAMPRLSKREAVSGNSNALLQLTLDLEVPCLLLAQ